MTWTTDNKMKKIIYLTLSILCLLPIATIANVVHGHVTLNGQTKEAEYYLNGTTARLGSGYNACISQYFVGKIEVPSSITVNGTTYPVTEVSKFAFRMCNHITEITLPEGITRIGDFAFVSCRSLQKVSLPSTLTTIGSGAFIDLPELERIDIYAPTPPTWEYNDVFCFHEDGIGDTHEYHTDQVVLFVPTCSLKLYHTTNYTNPGLGWTTPDGWGYFNSLGLIDASDFNFDVIFFNDGNWNEAGNWSSGTVPNSPSKDLLILADVTIPDGYVAKADEITVCGGSITIKDGGQLMLHNTGVVATVEKDILGFEQCGDGYHLLSNPVINEQNPVALGMTSGNYDLYYFDQSKNPEWRNYKQTPFNLTNSKGYLYTKATNANIAFNGELIPTNTEVDVELAYDAQANFAGLNLVGNPYCCNAYIADGRDFYTLNNDRDEFIVSTNTVIAPMQGVLLQASTDETLTFTTTEHSDGNALSISLSRNNKTIDKARIRKGEGHGLKKIQLDADHDKIYFPLEGNDYAVAYAGTLDVMPLNIKVENNGTYILLFDRENLSFDYLHLIDNLTGVDANLLQTPNYIFDVTDTDYENRFKIVFNPNWEDGLTDHLTDETGAFAFVSNGEIKLAETSQGASLQIIDMMGRIVFQGDAMNRVPTSGLTAGVYVLRLINGNDVKVQKMVLDF